MKKMYFHQEILLHYIKLMLSVSTISFKKCYIQHGLTELKDMPWTEIFLHAFI